MNFHILSIFPSVFDCYFSQSILKRAQNKGLIKIHIHNLRDYGVGKRRQVDDKPYGGGAGMIIKVEPVYKAVQRIASGKNYSQRKSRIILFSAKGNLYTQEDAKRFSKYENLILICGRYEGVDERVAEHIAQEEISVGNYVLSGGEIPAMIVVDSVSRLIPGVLGNPDSLTYESFSLKDDQFSKSKLGSGRKNNVQFRLLKFPQYTKPAIFRNWKVPNVLLSGNHKKIYEWRMKRVLKRTL